MKELANCVIETLVEDRELTTSRARTEDGSFSLLLTSPSSDRRPAAGVARLRHALALREELDFPGAARPLELIEFRGQTTLLIEDPGGRFLSELLGKPLPLQEFLRLAIGIAAALGELHRRGFVHKDVKPTNVIVNVQTGASWLVGFGLMSRASRHRQPPQPPETIAGTLSFMAPEQTGRMNRSIDSRSDLYSFGVTLYQMIVGELPFIADDPMEWVHSHIAKLPVAPSVRRKEIPQAISEIVMKLLSKAPEERYQTAAGVEADLKSCQKAWEFQGHITPFPLGAHDASGQLLIPEKLYGREHEVELLLAAFDRVVTDGRTELVLVSGYSGIGKSSVVNELHKSLVPPRGPFASGKFDQYQRDVPYATLAQALQKLVRQILTQIDADVLRWRKELVEALGPHGQIMIDIVPEMELIIGEQPAVADLPPNDAQNRFQMVFRRTLGVFARPEHPLALFLDDLQWLDTATLDLLHHLATHDEVRHLMLIGAYRDNEVSSAHPLMRMLAELNKAGAPVHEITLANLGMEDVVQLVSDSLHCPPKEARPLAQLLHEKTGGNPFFAIQFITALEEEGLIALSSESAGWRCDMDQIRAKGFTENVVDLMVVKLSRLPAPTQEILKRLACLGNSGQTETLAIVVEEPEPRVHEMLADAVQAGLVLRSGDVYSFAHDRIQEAALIMIPEEMRAAEHLRIGRLMASQFEDSEIEERIFDIVNQFNRVVHLISSPEERERVAEFNLLAGKRANSSAAHTSALIYFSAGSALLVPETWTRRYALAFELKLQEAACEVLDANSVGTEERIAELLVLAKSKVDLAAVYRLKFELHFRRSENALAVESAQKVLRTFGIEMPLHPSRAELESVYSEVWRKLGDRSIESLVDVPRATDPEAEAAMSVLAALYEPALFTDERLVGLHLGHMVLLTLERGVTEASAHAFGQFGITLGHFFGRYEDGYRFGQLARALVERHGFAAYEAKTLYSLEIVSFWTRPIGVAIEAIQACFVVAVRSGDIPYANYAGNHVVTDRLVRGDHLDEIWQVTERGLAFVRKTNFSVAAIVLITQQCLIQSLRGRTDSFDTFDREGFDESSFEASLDPERLPTLVCWYWIIKAQASFIYGNFESADKAFAKARPLLWSTLGLVQNIDYHFFSALTLAALDPGAASLLQLGEGRRQIQAHAEQLARWAESCPTTFADKYALVMAEVARIEGRPKEAEHLYEEAIRLARENGLLSDEGIANEVAARFYSSRGAERKAHSYLGEARCCFERWGASGKVRQFDLLDQRFIRHKEPTVTRPPDDVTGMDLDLAMVVKMSQAISEEIILSKLISRLISIAVECAGAERGLLILLDDEMPRIEAEAVIRDGRVTVIPREAAVTSDELPMTVLQFTMRTRESMILDDASASQLCSEDDYVRRTQSRSVLCLPIVKQTKFIGALYLENNLAPRVFTAGRVSVLTLLASQAAISLENARIHAKLRRSGGLMAEGQRVAHTDSWAWNPKTGKLTWSEAQKQMFGFSSDCELTFDDYAGTLHPEDRVVVLQTLDDAVSAGRPYDHEFRIVLPDGAIRFIYSSGRPVLDESGRVVEFLGATADITERKKSEDDLRRSAVLLEQTQRAAKTASLWWKPSTGEVRWSEQNYRLLQYPRSTRPSVPSHK